MRHWDRLAAGFGNACPKSVRQADETDAEREHRSVSDDRRQEALRIADHAADDKQASSPRGQDAGTDPRRTRWRIPPELIGRWGDPEGEAKVLGEGAYSRAWADGYAMNTETAVAYAGERGVG